MVSINVAQLLQSNPGAKRQVDFRERLADPTGELALTAPVQGRAKLTLTSRGVLVEVRYRTAVRTECSRCLDQVVVPVEGSFSEEFLPQTDIRTGLPSHLVEADPDLPRIDAHHEIQLDDQLRQDIVTCLPFQPLCREDCPGLCPTCGARLEFSHAAHDEAVPAEAEAVTESHTPFAHLAELLRATEHEGPVAADLPPDPGSRAQPRRDA